MADFQLILFITIGVLAAVCAFDIPEQIPESLVASWYSHYTKRFANPEEKKSILKRVKRLDAFGVDVDKRGRAEEACKAAARAIDSFSWETLNNCNSYGHSCWGGHGKK